MRLTRAATALICRALIGVFLLAQIAVAAHACGTGAALAQPATTMARDMPGCDRMVQPDPDAPNLCAEHCKVGQQTSDAGAAPLVHAPLATVLYVVDAQPPRVHGEGRIAASADPLFAAAPPPHAILHCVWRI